MGWSTVMAAVYDYGRPLVDDADPGDNAKALGLDEVAFLRPNADRHTIFATNFVDLHRGRDRRRPQVERKAVHDWLGTRALVVVAGIDTVAIHLFRGYANGVATDLADAISVVDPFDAIALANRAVDDAAGGSSRTRWAIAVGPAIPSTASAGCRWGHRATHRPSRARLEAGLVGDPFDEVLDTVLAKEALRWSYAAPDLAEATRRFDTFIAECKSSRVPEFTAWPAPPCAGAPRSWPITAPELPTGPSRR